jgi:hypothetical protein
MALLFADSVQHYTTVAQLLTKWTSGTGNVTISSTSGRASGPAISFVGNLSNPSQMFRSLGTNASTLVATTRMSFVSFQGGPEFIMRFMDGGTTLVGIALDASGKMYAYNGSSTALGDSGGFALSTNTLVSISMKATIHNTTGTVEVRVAGVPWITLTNKNTRGPGANNYANAFSIGYSTANSFVNGRQMYACDVVVNDTTGSGLLADFPGDVCVDYKAVDGAGALQNSTIAGTSPAATRWQGVDETTPNDDTDRNDLTAVGQEDTFTFGNVSTAATVVGAQAVARMASDVAGTNTDRLMLRIAGTNYESTDLSVPSTSYTYLLYPWSQSPATSSAFTPTELNGAEVGVKKTA